MKYTSFTLVFKRHYIEINRNGHYIVRLGYMTCYVTTRLRETVGSRSYRAKGDYLLRSML